MNTEQALKYISEFKGENLKAKFDSIKGDLVGKDISTLINQPLLFEAALEVKKVSAQINEIVHAAGIIKCLPLILEPGEVIENLSLAAGAEGEGFDLVTNKRIAEFKFSRWQDGKANGVRKRQAFSDFISLMLETTNKRKELYAYGAETIKKCFSSKRASWKKLLSRNPILSVKLEEYMNAISNNGQSLFHACSSAQVAIIDIDDLLGGEHGAPR